MFSDSLRALPSLLIPPRSIPTFYSLNSASHHQSPFVVSVARKRKIIAAFDFISKFFVLVLESDNFVASSRRVGQCPMILAVTSDVKIFQALKFLPLINFVDEF